MVVYLSEGDMIEESDLCELDYECVDAEFGYICDCGSHGETDGSNKCPDCGAVLWTVVLLTLQKM
jgi:hypothetical protein